MAPQPKAAHLSPEALYAWRKRMRLKVKEAAEALGVAVATYNRWEREGADKRTALACAAISHGIPEIRG